MHLWSDPWRACAEERSLANPRLTRLAVARGTRVRRQEHRMIRMKAALVEKARAPLIVDEVELDDPHEGEVQVKIVASGVCHSCLHAADGSWSEIPVPIVLGDEGAGIIAKVGKGVTHLKEGDHAILSWAPSCGQCHYCVTGRPVHCEVRADKPARLADGTTRMRWRGETLYRFGTVASHSEYTTIPSSSAIKIRDDVPLTTVALIGCSVMTGVGAVLNTAQVPAGATVAIWGAGGIGLNVVQGAALAAAGEIIVVDMLDNKLEFARKFGATHTINASTTDPVETIRSLTRRGVEYAFVATGHTKAIEQAWQSLANAGTCVVIGMPGTGELVQISGRGIAGSERVLRGSFYGSARTRVDFPRMVELYRSGKLDIDGLINRKFALDDADEAYRALAAGELARGIIVN